MKKKIFLSLYVLLLLALFGAEPNGTTIAAEHTIQVYFASSDFSSGSALTSETRALQSNRDTIQQSIDWLLAGPEEAGHDSIFPDGVTLISKKQDGTNLTLNFSKAYSDLTGASLTTADGAVVLTLTQLDNVDSITILSAGEPVASSGGTLLTAKDFDLAGKSADPISMELPLVFLSENGKKAVTEPREIKASTSSVSAEAEAVLDALCTGPETKGLRSFLPTTTDGLTIKIKNKTCTLSLSNEWHDALLDTDGNATLSAWALTTSLAALDGIDKITYQESGKEVPGLSSDNIAVVYNNYS